MRTTQELIAVTMTALTALSNHIKENTHLYEDFDVAMDNQKEANEVEDGQVLEIMKERLDKPEEGKIYSLLELSKTKKWSESEVVEEAQIPDIEMTDEDFDALFESL